ncbi:hypothetical protein Q7P35_002225 [Cladosporium inversicolor]
MTTLSNDPPTDRAQVDRGTVAEDPYFLPLLPRFAPELDYLATLDAFLDEYEASAEGKKLERSKIRIYKDIWDTRKRLLHRERKSPCILIVQDVDVDAVQLLGTALDLNLAFLLQHLWPVDDDFDSDESATMSDKFLEFLKVKKSEYRGTLSVAGDDIIGTSGTRATASTAQSQSDWSTVHLTGHATGGSGSLYHRISCLRVSPHGWLILVGRPRTTLPCEIMVGSPFRRRNMLSFRELATQGACLPQSIRLCHQVEAELHRDGYSAKHQWDIDPFDLFARIQDLFTNKMSFLNPTKTESTKDELDLLFGHGDDSLDQASFALALAWLLAASTWQSNINAFDHRLKQLRTTAMMTPSLLTFQPIPLLRQNVEDMDTALQEMKESITEIDHEAFAKLRLLANHPLQTLENIFDTLLKRTAALSSTAGNEIQLVIGSVTIQDSDMMKRQSRRATLLTLLAAFYLPLTLVTGIFGMNIKEFDDAKPPFVLCFGALFAVIGVTGIFYVICRFLPRLLRGIRDVGLDVLYRWKPYKQFVDERKLAKDMQSSYRTMRESSVYKLA